MTWYITLRSDKNYACYQDTSRVLAYLRTECRLSEINPGKFRSSGGYPPLVLILAECDSAGSYAVEKLPSRVNVIELVCFEEEDEFYYSLARDMAAFLGWEATTDHETLQIWPLSDTTPE